MAIRNRTLLRFLRIIAVIFLVVAAFVLRRSIVVDGNSWSSVRAAQAAAVAGPATVPGAAGPLGRGTGPQLAGCPIFPADNVWNTRIDKLKVDEHSAAYLSKMGSQLPLRANFGSEPTNGIPITVVRFNTPRSAVDFEYRDGSDLGKYPIPPNVAIEGGGLDPEGDNHILLVDEDRCELFEIYGAVKQPDGTWKAGSGIKMDLTSDGLRDEGKTSADAAGLAILPGLVRYDEMEAGAIRHAIRFTVPKTQRAYIWPATHFASKITDTSYPPMGLRLRLRANVDISSYSKTNQIILTALKRYGMILADNGSPWFIIGAPDSRWNDDDLRKLRGIKGSDFEVVDESDLQFIQDSARVDPVSQR